jgi:hypothetical protein
MGLGVVGLGLVGMAGLSGLGGWGLGLGLLASLYSLGLGWMGWSRPLLELEGGRLFFRPSLSAPASALPISELRGVELQQGRLHLRCKRRGDLIYPASQLSPRAMRALIAVLGGEPGGSRGA